jgi:hypothetical protein
LKISESIRTPCFNCKASSTTYNMTALPSSATASQAPRRNMTALHSSSLLFLCPSRSSITPCSESFLLSGHPSPSSSVFSCFTILSPSLSPFPPIYKMPSFSSLNIFLSQSSRCLLSLVLSLTQLSLTSMSDPTQPPFTQRFPQYHFTPPSSSFPHSINQIDSRASVGYPNGLAWSAPNFMNGGDHSLSVSSMTSPLLPPVPPNTPCRPVASEVASRRGRPNGSGNYADQDIKTLLLLIEAELPVGSRGWQAVHSRYSKWAGNKARPQRTAKSLENKFRQVSFIYTSGLMFDPYCSSARKDYQADWEWYLLPPRYQGSPNRRAH